MAKNRLYLKSNRKERKKEDIGIGDHEKDVMSRNSQVIPQILDLIMVMGIVLVKGVWEDAVRTEKGPL